ncbi:MAG: potassium channel family protein [Thermomicrobium sp.]|nr:potassium channel family protein [Thermomicrobium sp.]
MAVFAIGAVALLVFPRSWQSDLLSHAIWVVFVADSVIRLGRARDRLRFVRDHWIEAIAILPWDLLRVVRVLRLVRLVRVFRAGVWFWRATRELQTIARQNGLGYVLLVAAGIVLVGSAVFWIVEPSVHGYGEALWWAVVTVTTVGYGNVAPRTAAGRAVAVVLMVVGISVIGMLTSSLATYFLGVRRRSPHPTVEYVRERLVSWDELDPRERHE